MKGFNNEVSDSMCLRNQGQNGHAKKSEKTTPKRTVDRKASRARRVRNGKISYVTTKEERRGKKLTRQQRLAANQAAL